MKYGYDVSSVQGAVNWANTPADFAYIKCCTGNDAGVDPQFQNNVTGCKANNIPCGAYFFAYPLPPGKPGRDPKDQAAIFYNKSSGLGMLQGDLPPVLDLEWPELGDWVKWGCSASQIVDWTVSCLAEMTSLWGKLPVVYTYPYFMSCLAAVNLDRLAAYPLWIADYTFPSSRPNDGNAPRKVAPWDTWTIWQHSGGGIKLPNGCPVDGDCIQDSTLAQFIGT